MQLSNLKNNPENSAIIFFQTKNFWYVQDASSNY